MPLGRLPDIRWTRGGSLRDMSDGARIEGSLWPFFERVVAARALPGLAVCVLHDGQVAARGFGRHHRTGEAVSADALFHLASMSKTFVATAVLQLVEAGELDLDSCITAYLPDLPWVDPRADRITVAQLLSHTSGLGDVSDYGWHEPELDDGALARFAAEVAGWSLEHDPGEQYSYSNAAFELLGHLVAVVGGQSFEGHLKEHVLDRAGMTTSTHLYADVPPHLDAGAHVGLPPRVVDGARPYTRRHAPSSTLHSSAAELGRWMRAHLARGAGLMSPATHEQLWRPRVDVGDSDLHEQMALGWFRGTYRDQRTVGHSGSDPGFQTNLALLPQLGLGVAVLANSNTPLFGLTRSAIDVLLGHEPSPDALPPVTVALGPVLEASGVEAAADLYRLLATAPEPEYALDDDAFDDAVWGAIELHRADRAWPVLDVWRRVLPGSSAAHAMAGWAHEVDGRPADAVADLRHALELDPGNEDADARLRRIIAAGP